MPQDAPERVVIVGGGVAAQRCAFALRARGFAGQVVVVCAESHLPYDRTLLSKDVLTGSATPAQLPLRTAADYEDLGIELRLGVAAAGVRAPERRLELADGTSLPYDRLVVATGGTPALPPALAHPGAHVLRGLDHAQALRTALARCGRLIVVGGGFIGGEIAASARALGLSVTIVEALAAPLARVVGVEVGTRIAALHERAGVRMLTGTAVGAVRAAADAEVEVALVDGRTLTADAVVVGAGMVPAVQWLAGSGVELDRGVITDAACRTAVPDVLAAGDCARWWNPRYGRLARVEHWDTAGRHGAAAAASALGDEEAFAPVPFFWSVQHGVRFQWVGDATGADRVEIEDGDPPDAFVARYHREDRLVAAFAAGQPRAVAAARRELEAAEAVPA